MRSHLSTITALTLSFGLAGAAALATDCRLDSAIDCCEGSIGYQIAVRDSPPDCPSVVVVSTSWLPRTVEHENGFTAIQETSALCLYQYYTFINNICILSQTTGSFCYGNRVADNSIPCNGGGANP